MKPNQQFWPFFSKQKGSADFSLAAFLGLQFTAALKRSRSNNAICFPL